MDEAPAPRCYRHPDRETYVSCSECGRPICEECMTFAPVGIRCPEHATVGPGAKPSPKISAASTASTGSASAGSSVGREPTPEELALELQPLLKIDS